MIQEDGGAEIILEGRAWNFAQELGLTVDVGTPLRVTGYYEDSTFKIVELEKLPSAERITLRDLSGRPLWSAQGRRGVSS